MRTCVACGRSLNLASGFMVWVIVGIDGGVAPRYWPCGEALTVNVQAA